MRPRLRSYSTRRFFPTIDPLAGTLAALGTYAVGFLARPLGGALFGHFGDRLGRKSMLVATMFIMGLSTFCIGLLPNYASIGVLAPILLILLRVIQGIGLGGEWGGASLMVIEHAPADKRGFYGSFVQIGFPGGACACNTGLRARDKASRGRFSSVGLAYPVPGQHRSAGAWYIHSIEGSGDAGFRENEGDRVVLEKSRSVRPVSKNFKTFLIAVGLKLSEVSWVYMLTVFVVVYARPSWLCPSNCCSMPSCMPRCSS